MRGVVKCLAVPFLLLCAQPVCAQTASGAYVEKKLFSDDPGPEIKVSLPLSHAAALRKDDAEGALDGEGGIWVLLSDNIVDPMAMAGGVFPPVRRMAKAGVFRGILFVIKPAERDRLVVTALYNRPDEPGNFATQTISNNQGVWKSLTVTPTRVTGAYDDGAGMAFSFDAPIAENPITQDLRGPAALASPLADIVIRHARAFQAGDFEALKALESHDSWKESEAMSPEQRAAMVRFARADPDAAKQLKITRVTIRGRTAIVQTEGGNQSLVLEDGGWKVD